MAGEPVEYSVDTESSHTVILIPHNIEKLRSLVITPSQVGTLLLELLRDLLQSKLLNCSLKFDMLSHISVNNIAW